MARALFGGQPCPGGGQTRPMRPVPTARPATVILLEPAAPPKPPAGADCNGCGACCAWRPCPLGQLLTRRRHGRCAALNWSDTSAHYRCGALAEPARWLPLLRWLPAAWANRVGRRLVRRWIAAGRGCDAHFDAEPTT